MGPQIGYTHTRKGRRQLLGSMAAALSKSDHRLEAVDSRCPPIRRVPRKNASFERQPEACP